MIAPADNLADLREIVDHIAAHDLADNVLSIKPRGWARYPNEVHVSAGSNGSAVELLSQWAASLDAHRVDAELMFGSPESTYHLSVTGLLPSGAQLEVTVITGSAETAALAADNLSGDIRLAAVVTAAAGALP